MKTEKEILSRCDSLIEESIQTGHDFDGLKLKEKYEQLRKNIIAMDNETKNQMGRSIDHYYEKMIILEAKVEALAWVLEL